MRRWLLLAAVLAGWAGTAVAAAASPPVRSLEVQADGPVNPQRVERLLGLEEGRPLVPETLRRGIRVLWAEGRVDDVWVTTAPEGHGLAVTVHLSMKPRIEEVRLVGVGRRWRGRIRRWMELHPGQLFDQSKLERSLASLRRRLGEEGFPEAEVNPTLDYHRFHNSVALSLRIDLGTPELVDAVRVLGVEDPDGRLARATGLKPGRRLTARRVEKARDRLERALRLSGRWEGQVLAVERRRGKAGTLVRFTVDPGPLWRLEVSGGKAAENLAGKLLPDPADGTLNPSQPEVVADKLREELERRGYLLAQVRAQVRGEGGGKVLAIDVKPGPRVKVKEVVFPGAEAVSARRLRKLVNVRRGGVGGWKGQQLTSGTLEQDRRTVLELYHRKGFLEAEVDPPRVVPLEGNRVRIVFPLREGRRWRVAELRLEGFPVEVLQAVEGPLPLKEEGPWNPDLLGPTRRTLELALASAGYPDGRVTASVDTSRPGEAAVVLRADPGPYVRLEDVVVTGLSRTAESVVRGVLQRHRVQTGEPYALSHILDAQQELYQLGLFRRVEIVPLPGEERGPRRGLLVRCEEGLQRSYVLGFGWDTESKARLILGWSHLNLLGHAHAVGAELRLSSREKRFQTNLREHDVLGLGVPGYLTAYRTEETFSSFSQRRRGLWVDVGDRRRRPFRLWIRYEYQLVRPDAPPEILSQLEREQREIRIASLTPTLEWDTRDDLLDPSRGLLISLSPQLAFPLFAADAHFLKLEGRVSLFGRLPGGTGALGLHLGAIEPLGVGGNLAENLKIPLNARFFAGGRISHRAFPVDRLGIPGQTLDVDGDPTGGNALAILNLEYRRHLRGAVSGVLFLDAGNVWADPGKVRLTDVRWGLGLGLRVHTPAGPVRLEYGRKLDRKPGESAGELFLSFGAAF